MIPWGAGRHQRDARWIKSYTKARLSGVGGRVQIALGNNDARQSPDRCQAEDEVRTGVVAVDQGGDTSSHQAPGERAQSDSPAVGPAVIESLDQETVASDDAEHSASGQRRGPCPAARACAKKSSSHRR